jgi:hypothetical protein
MTPPVREVRNAWPRVVALVLIFALLVGGTVFVLREVINAPAKLVEQSGGLIKEGGRQLRSLAESFNRGTVRTEFVSHAAEVAGTNRFQFATLKQNEFFKREEEGNTAWGWVPLPRVVVEARAPVEYTYTVDFSGAWQFDREGDWLRVIAPPIEANAPAVDVSALQFYTVEGSIWRDESAVRDRLRQSLSAALRERAIDNEKLVREIGRQRLAEFVEKWLANNFDDSKRLHVKVVFPDEVPQTPTALENR